MFPPNGSFFRMSVDEAVIEKYGKQNPRLVTEIETSLSKFERAVMKDIESSGVQLKEMVLRQYPNVTASLECVPIPETAKLEGEEDHASHRVSGS